MHKDVKEIFFSQQQIAQRCKELGAQITEDYKGREDEVIFIGILKGSVPFLADLIRCVELDIAFDTMAVSSYAGTESVGRITVKKDVESSIVDKDVIIVEDIIDTGLTLYELKKLLYARGARNVKIVCLLNKQARRKADVQADYVGFEVADEFVIGYGLDFNQKYRNLPYIGILKEECYK